jgi:hypothetical protein
MSKEIHVVGVNGLGQKQEVSLKKRYLVEINLL